MHQITASCKGVSMVSTLDDAVHAGHLFTHTLNLKDAGQMGKGGLCHCSLAAHMFSCGLIF